MFMDASFPIASKRLESFVLASMRAVLLSDFSRTVSVVMLGENDCHSQDYRCNLLERALVNFLNV
jgi:hypothetical protein